MPWHYTRAPLTGPPRIISIQLCVFVSWTSVSRLWVRLTCEWAALAEWHASYCLWWSRVLYGCAGLISWRGFPVSSPQLWCLERELESIGHCTFASDISQRYVVRFLLFWLNCRLKIWIWRIMGALLGSFSENVPRKRSPKRIPLSKLLPFVFQMFGVWRMKCYATCAIVRFLSMLLQMLVTNFINNWWSLEVANLHKTL